MPDVRLGNVELARGQLVLAQTRVGLGRLQGQHADVGLVRDGLKFPGGVLQMLQRLGILLPDIAALRQCQQGGAHALPRTGFTRQRQSLLQGCNGSRGIAPFGRQKPQLQVDHHLFLLVLLALRRRHRLAQVVAGLVVFAKSSIDGGDADEVGLCGRRIAHGFIEALRLQEIEQRLRLLAQQRLGAAAPGQSVGDQATVLQAPRNPDALLVSRQRVAFRGDPALVETAANLEVGLRLQVARLAGLLDAATCVGVAAVGVVVERQEAVHVFVAPSPIGIVGRQQDTQAIEGVVDGRPAVESHLTVVQSPDELVERHRVAHRCLRRRFGMRAQRRRQQQHQHTRQTTK